MSVMKTEKDILKSAPELKTMPYSVPDGYFDSLKTGLKAVAAGSDARRKPAVVRLAPYAAMAAVFVFLVTAGTFLLERTTPSLPEDADEFLFYSDILPVTDPYAIGTEHTEDEYIAEEDIIEYLIYSGVTAEVIETSRD